MYSLRNDYDKIIKGEYSKISEPYKIFMSLSEKNLIVQKCLEPESNYQEFADLLGIPSEELRGKELLSPPNYQEETIFVLPSIKQKIIDEYGFS